MKIGEKLTSVKLTENVKLATVTDDINQLLLSSYDDLSVFFSSDNGRVILAKPNFKPSRQSVKEIEYNSPVSGELSDVKEVEINEYVVKEIEHLKKTYLKGDNLDKIDPDLRQKIYPLESFIEILEANYQGNILKLDNKYVIVNWGIKNAPKIGGIDTSEIDLKPKAKFRWEINGDTVLLDATDSIGDIDKYRWLVAGVKHYGKKIEIQLERKSGSVDAELTVEDSFGRISTNKKIIEISSTEPIVGADKTDQNGEGHEKPSEPKVGHNTPAAGDNKTPSEIEKSDPIKEAGIKRWFEDNWRWLLIILIIILLLIWGIYNINGSTNHQTSTDNASQSKVEKSTSSTEMSSNSRQSGVSQGADSKEPNDKNSSNGNSNLSGDSKSDGEESVDGNMSNGDVPSKRQYSEKEMRALPFVEKLSPKTDGQGLNQEGLKDIGDLLFFEDDQYYYYWLRIGEEDILLDKIPKQVPLDELQDSDNYGGSI